MAKKLLNGNLKWIIGYLITAATLIFAAGGIRIDVKNSLAKDIEQDKKIDHFDENLHEIKTSIAELVLEQKHMNEGIKKLAGIN